MIVKPSWLLWASITLRNNPSWTQAKQFFKMKKHFTVKKNISGLRELNE